MKLHHMVPKKRATHLMGKLEVLNEEKHTVLNDAFKWLIIFMYATEGLLISGNLISYLILLSIPPRCQNRSGTQTRGPVTKGFAMCGPRPDQSPQAVSEHLSDGTWIRQKDGLYEQGQSLGIYSLRTSAHIWRTDATTHFLASPLQQNQQLYSEAMSHWTSLVE